MDVDSAYFPTELEQRTDAFSNATQGATLLLATQPMGNHTALDETMLCTLITEAQVGMDSCHCCESCTCRHLTSLNLSPAACCCVCCAPLSIPCACTQQVFSLLEHF